MCADDGATEDVKEPPQKVPKIERDDGLDDGLRTWLTWLETTRDQPLAADSCLSSLQSLDEPVVKLLDQLGVFGFDALAFCAQVGNKPISIAGNRLETKYNIIDSLAKTGSICSGADSFHTAFLAFLGKLDLLYNPQAVYHGSAHAVDVMATAMSFMQSEFIASNRQALDNFTVMMASAVHDVGHPGVNNAFLSKTKHPIAVKYSDTSVLENMHAALAFRIMSEHVETDWLQKLDATVQEQVRANLTTMVLGTDMAKHSDAVKAIEAFDCNAEPKDLKVVYKTLVHFADIANASKPRHQMLGWTKRVLEEFWSQGDREQQLGLEISPLCDRESGMKSVAKGQIGFINFVVVPYAKHFHRVIPEGEVALNGLAATKEYWEKAEADGLTYEQIFVDVA